MQQRILMFGWEFPPHHSGGLGVACFGLTRALSRLGYDLIFVMPKKLNGVGAPWARFVFADAPRMTTIAVDSPVLPYLPSKSSLRRLPDGQEITYGWNLMEEVLRYAAAGASIAREEQFDVIYAHDWLSFGAGLAAKRATGKPLIAHVHATEFDRCGGSYGVNPDVYAIERAGMAGADAVIAVSEYTKSIIVNRYGIPPGKVYVVHNGIDDDTMPKGSGALPRLRTLKREGWKFVLFLGRITLQKGPDYFLRTAKRVIEHNPRVLFVMSGSGDMEEEMMRLSAKLGIANNVLFTGFVSGAERYEMYAAADLFVMPSVSEPFGITPLESMKLGTPVLVSKQSGIAEAVQHVLKADFWDVDEMTNKILAAIEMPGLSQTLAENGAREAETLTWDLAAGKVGDVVRGVS